LALDKGSDEILPYFTVTYTIFFGMPSFLRDSIFELAFVAQRYGMMMPRDALPLDKTYYGRIA